MTIGTIRPVSASASLQPVDLVAALGVGRAEREQVVVVEGEAVGAELGELVHGVRPRRAGARVGPPNGSVPLQPTVHRPKVNLSEACGVRVTGVQSLVGERMLWDSTYLSARQVSTTRARNPNADGDLPRLGARRDRAARDGGASTRTN